MTLDTVIMGFGAFIALLPFLQFPISWQTGFSFIAGIIVIGLGIIVRRRRGKWESSERMYSQAISEDKNERESVQ